MKLATFTDNNETRIGVVDPVSRALSAFSNRTSSTYGPFFKLRPIDRPSCLSVRLLLPAQLH